MFRHLLTAAIFAVLGGAPAMCAMTFHVAATEDASDHNPGTEVAPWRTLAHARDALRPLIAAGLAEDVVVSIKSGIYLLEEPLTFGPEDGGTAEHSVTYAAAEGETVIVSGGRPITGWRAVGGNLWTTQVAGVTEGHWYPELLVVNGRRATRARIPNADADPPYLQIMAQELDVAGKRLRLVFPPGLISHWDNPTDVELVCQGNWAINRKRVLDLDPAGNAATFVLPAARQDDLPWNWPGPGRWFFLENALEFLDEPGEWYLDRATGVLTYWPREGEDLATAQVYAPRVVGLVQIAGTPERPVRNLHLRGLRLEHSAWPLPPGDYHGVQACHYATGSDAAWNVVPCAVRLECAQECSITDGSVAHCEAGGIELARRCTDCLIQGNEITDIGGNGVMVGGPNDDAEAPRRNRVDSNRVHRCGARFFGAVGIWVGFAAETAVTHNLVHDLPYSGISVGWVWAAEPSACKGNLIADNHIFDCMQKLCDGGGIYTLGLQPGTVIRGNLIHDIYRSPFAQGAPNNGMFIDEGSMGFVFQGNVIYATPEGAVRHNANSPLGHTWQDNHFGLPLWAPGLMGGALSCPAAHVEVPHSPELEPATLTLEAWVNLDHFPVGGDPRRWVVNKTDDEWTQGHYALNTWGDRVGAYLNIGGGRENMLDAWSPSGVLTLNRWHHLAMTYDGMTLRVYCDGEPVAEKELNRPREPGTGPLAIGRRQDAYNSFEGLIDEVRVYNRALSAEEIAGHFAAGSAVPPRPLDPAREPGLVGYWGFDDSAEAEQIVAAIRAVVGPLSPWRERWADR